MRVFMLGWEFPPFISGGLGTACYGLTKAMSSLGTDVMFVLPRPVSTPFSTHVRLVSPRPGSPLAAPSTEFRLDEFEHVTFRTVNAALTSPYNTPCDYDPNCTADDEANGPATSDDVADAPTGTARLVKESTKIRRPTALSAAGAAADAASAATPGFIGAGAPGTNYAGDLFSEVQRYAALASEVARNESFDVVHAHDGMTFPAGLAVAGMKGVP